MADGAVASTGTPVTNRLSWFSSILSSTLTVTSVPLVPLACGLVISRRWSSVGGMIDVGAVCAFDFMLAMLLPPVRCGPPRDLTDFLPFPWPLPLRTGDLVGLCFFADCARRDASGLSSPPEDNDESELSDEYDTRRLFGGRSSSPSRVSLRKDDSRDRVRLSSSSDGTAWLDMRRCWMEAKNEARTERAKDIG